MSNVPQGQKPQAQKSDYSNQSNVGKVGNNTHKDEPTAHKKAGEVKDNASNTSSHASKPSKAS
jgi:hypothetical protein